TLALLSVSALLIFNLISMHLIEVVQSKTEIYIDVTKDAQQTQVDYLVEELAKLPDVSQVKFINADDALTKFKERNQGNELLLSSLAVLEQNPFAGSLMVKVKDLNDMPSLLAELGKDEYKTILEIDNSEFYQTRDLINNIAKYTEQIRKIGFGLSIFFIIIAGIVVFNTIQMGIYAHREEIGIMKLVGASNWFIRTPFFLQGIMYSLFSMFIILLLIFPLVSWLQPYFDQFFGDYSTNLVQLLMNNFLFVFGIEIIVAIFITFIASTLAMRRYLKI
ncbi:MAG: hypothetical protein CO133_00650, partial [Candidatus Komeilibacteria bacterium CG_4_9_14_3_um_filter_37_5]